MNESVHYHHRIDGYSCHGRVERVTLQEKCPEWVVAEIGPDGFCSIPDLVQIGSRFGPDLVHSLSSSLGKKSDASSDMS